MPTGVFLWTWEQLVCWQTAFPKQQEDACRSLQEAVSWPTLGEPWTLRLADRAAHRRLWVERETPVLLARHSPGDTWQDLAQTTLTRTAVPPREEEACPRQDDGPLKVISHLQTEGGRKPNGKDKGKKEGEREREGGGEREWEKERKIGEKRENAIGQGN